MVDLRGQLCLWTGVLLLAVLLRKCGSDEAVVTVDVRTTKDLIMSSGHLYLDVRTAEEFERGHVEKAHNVPSMLSTSQGRVNNREFLDKVASLCNKDDFIVVGCQSGVRSLKAAADLLKAGFKNVKNMEGGYAAWVENGFDATTKREEL